MAWKILAWLCQPISNFPSGICVQRQIPSLTIVTTLPVRCFQGFDSIRAKIQQRVEDRGKSGKWLQCAKIGVWTSPSPYLSTSQCPSLAPNRSVIALVLVPIEFHDERLTTHNTFITSPPSSRSWWRRIQSSSIPESKLSAGAKSPQTGFSIRTPHHRHVRLLSSLGNSSRRSTGTS